MVILHSTGGRRIYQLTSNCNIVYRQHSQLISSRFLIRWSQSYWIRTYRRNRRSKSIHPECGCSSQTKLGDFFFSNFKDFFEVFICVPRSNKSYVGCERLGKQWSVADIRFKLTSETICSWSCVGYLSILMLVQHQGPFVRHRITRISWNDENDWPLTTTNSAYKNLLNVLLRHELRLHIYIHFMLGFFFILCARVYIRISEQIYLLKQTNINIYFFY